MKIDNNQLEKYIEEYCKDKFFDDEFEYYRVQNAFKAGFLKALEKIQN